MRRVGGRDLRAALLRRLRQPGDRQHAGAIDGRSSGHAASHAIAPSKRDPISVRRITMRTEKKNHDQILEQAITEIRAGQLSDADVKQAAARVWARVGQAASTVQSQAIDVGKADGPVHLHGCADFQALIPVYLTKKLPEAHLWLFEDHMHSCPACRSALEHARSGKIVEFEPKTRRNLVAAPEWKWAIAAAVQARAHSMRSQRSSSGWRKVWRRKKSSRRASRERLSNGHGRSVHTRRWLGGRARAGTLCGGESAAAVKNGRRH